jgi:hypothetical protein
MIPALFLLAFTLFSFHANSAVGIHVDDNDSSEYDIEFTIGCYDNEGNRDILSRRHTYELAKDVLDTFLDGDCDIMENKKNSEK